ncbi:glycosyltransferase [Limosilactobacillus balticus]|uniref:glycosyltransferase family 4 protein n=1 Tax=Limosilactobacillus balticus TaxID=2759747 RepID=UPI001E3146EB|nr:glycosyltransferase [Limosilactobacillus balticus]MCD7136832.1 glycosyltransferase [Limosilactobacillus balticus]
MKLIVLTKQFGTYTGATVSTIEILKRIAKDFESVTVITMKSEKVNIKNVKILVVPSYKDLISEVRKRKNIQNSIGYSDDHLGFLFSFFNIDYIHTYHGNWPDARWMNSKMFFKSLFFISMYKLTIKKAEHVVSVSNYMNNKFVKKNTKKSTVIYNGIKQVKKSEPPSKDTQDIKFLMVGNVDSRKYAAAIDLFSLLSEKGFNNKIDIYGKIVESKIAEKLNEFDFVELKGMRNNINYTKYDALICTSVSENLPVSIVESIISGVPVISFNVGGISEVITEDDTGRLIPQGDMEHFAKAVQSFKKHIISKEIRNNINDKFNWDNSAQQYFKLLNGERNSK